MLASRGIINIFFLLYKQLYQCFQWSVHKEHPLLPSRFIQVYLYLGGQGFLCNPKNSGDNKQICDVSIDVLAMVNGTLNRVIG